MKETENFRLIDVGPSTLEYIEVIKDFQKNMTKQLTIIKLQRIQNKPVYEAYLTYKKRLKLKNSIENEMTLYHGTKNSKLENICRLGFDRSYSGINGAAYGQGVYFSLSSAYSHKFTEKQNQSSMFRVKVLVGESILGESSMKRPPKKANGDHYDSTCDQSKSIFVCYHDNQCYPEYLITYTV